MTAYRSGNALVEVAEVKVNHHYFHGQDRSYTIDRPAHMPAPTTVEWQRAIARRTAQEIEQVLDASARAKGQRPVTTNRRLSKKDDAKIDAKIDGQIAASRWDRAAARSGAHASAVEVLAAVAEERALWREVVATAEREKRKDAKRLSDLHRQATAVRRAASRTNP